MLDFMTRKNDGIDIDANGTSLKGTIHATRAVLTEKFGEPEFYGEGDKVTVEWIIRFDDGTIATIYDWKRYELGTPELEELEEYHIGGNNLKAVDLVHAVMRN